MGFIFLGIASLNVIGLTGAVLVMIAHGLLAALAFGLSGHLYRQTGSLDMSRMGGLLRQMPLAGSALLMALFAGCGLPGFANFAAEITIFFAAWSAGLKTITVIAAWSALVIGGLYMMRAIRSILHGPLGGDWAKASDLSPLVSDGAWTAARRVAGVRLRAGAADQRHRGRSDENRALGQAGCRCKPSASHGGGREVTRHGRSTAIHSTRGDGGGAGAARPARRFVCVGGGAPLAGLGRRRGAWPRVPTEFSRAAYVALAEIKANGERHRPAVRRYLSARRPGAVLQAILPVDGNLCADFCDGLRLSAEGRRVGISRVHPVRAVRDDVRLIGERLQFVVRRDRIDHGDILHPRQLSAAPDALA